MTETRIAAVVNDEAISVNDVRSRIKMVMLSSNLTDTPDTRQRIASQVLRTIEEVWQSASSGTFRSTEPSVGRGL